MKVLAKFYGKVNKFNAPPAPSYVLLKNVDTGELCETDAVSEKLVEAGIDHDGCEFEVVIQEDNGKPEAVMHKLEPKKLSDEELKEISDEVDRKLTSDDFSI